MLRGRTDGDRQIEEFLLDRSASITRARHPLLVSAGDLDRGTSLLARQHDPRSRKTIEFARLHSTTAAPRERDSLRIPRGAEENTLLHRSRTELRVAPYVP